MTWKDFQICLIAFERNQLEEWRRVRALAHIMYTSNGGEKNINQFWPLPGDPQAEKRIPLTPEQMANVFSIYK